MKALLYYMPLLLLLISACDKVDEPRKPVWAGVYDNTMDYTELNPALEIALKHDSLWNVDYGVDSLDIDQDGSFDIIISQRIPTDYNYPSSTTNDTYPFYKLNLKNGIEVAYKMETYYIGHGQTSSAQWIDTIAYKENVLDITSWTESNIYRFLWVDPPTIFWGSNGPWYNLINTERYIAIRKYTSSRYCYGWIKVKVVSREHLSFVSFALEDP
jgi:hypothetical protein